MSGCTGISKSLAETALFQCQQHLAQNQYVPLSCSEFGQNSDPSDPCQTCLTGGLPGVIWRKEDIPSNEAIDKYIVPFLDKQNFSAIAFDIEGMTLEFAEESGNYDPTTGQFEGGSNDTYSNHFLKQCGRIKKAGYGVWIILPGYNNISCVDESPSAQTGSPPAVKYRPFQIPKAYAQYITLVQLMIYGNGLDSTCAGDPSGPKTCQYETEKACNNDSSSSNCKWENGKCKATACGDTCKGDFPCCIGQCLKSDTVAPNVLDALTNKARGISEVPPSQKNDGLILS